MSIVANPIAWVQFRLQGGWKRLLLTGAAFFVVLGLIMFGMVQTQHSNSAPFVYRTFAELFLGLQFLALPVFGSWRVGGAVRADVRNRMIESHRLMPVGAGRAIAGYLFGAPATVFGFAGANFVLGAIAVNGAGLSMQAWAFANAVLLAFSVFLWVIVLFFSFRSGWVFPAVIFGVLAVVMSNALVLTFFPGAMVLAGPMIGETIFSIVGRSAATMQYEPYLISIGLNAAIAALYFMAAARRYRRDDALGFGPGLGLLLLVLWLSACIAGMVWQNLFEPARGIFFYGSYDPDTRLDFCFGLSMLLAILPVASAVRLIEIPPAGVKRASWALPVATLVVATAACLMLVIAAPTTIKEWTPVVRTAIVIGAFLIGIRYVLAIAYRRKLWPRATVLGWLLLTWAVPMIAEAFRQAWATGPDANRMSQLMTICPLGQIYSIWSEFPSYRVVGNVGLIVQCCLAAGAALSYYGLRRPRVATALPVPVPA